MIFGKKLLPHAHLIQQFRRPRLRDGEHIIRTDCVGVGFGRQAYDGIVDMVLTTERILFVRPTSRRFAAFIRCLNIWNWELELYRVHRIWRWEPEFAMPPMLHLDDLLTASSCYFTLLDSQTFKRAPIDEARAHCDAVERAWTAARDRKEQPA